MPISPRTNRGFAVANGVPGIIGINTLAFIYSYSLNSYQKSLTIDAFNGLREVHTSVLNLLPAFKNARPAANCQPTLHHRHLANTTKTVLYLFCKQLLP